MTLDIAARGHLASLTEASVALADAGLDQPVVLDTITNLLVQHLDGSSVAYLLTDDGTRFEMAAVSSDDPATVMRVERVEANLEHHVDGVGLLARCARNRRPLRLPRVDVSALSPVPREYRDTVQPPSWRTLLFVPLVTDGELLGVIVVTRSLDVRPPLCDAEVDLACDLGELASAALANTHLHRALAATTTLFETAFREAAIGMALVSASAGPNLGRLLWVNSALMEMTGYDESTLEAMSVHELFPSEVRQRIESDLVTSTETDVADSLARGRLLRSDNSVTQVRIEARAVSVGGRPGRIGLLQVHPAD